MKAMLPDDESRDYAFGAEAGSQWAEHTDEATARRFLDVALVGGKPARPPVDLPSLAQLAIRLARAILGDPHADAQSVMGFWTTAFPAPSGRRWAAFLQGFIAAAADALSDRLDDEHGELGKLVRSPSLPN